MSKLILEWLWPCLTPLSPEEKTQQEKWLLGEKDKIDRGSWSNKGSVALEEARRLFDAEQDRRRGADSKAGLYLAAITALMPLLATILPGLLDGQISTALKCTLLGMFICALLYLMRAGLWALQTLKVSASTHLGASDIVQSLESNQPENGLVKQLLRAVIDNYTGTNQKVSCIKMAHEFLLRAFLCFAVLLVAQVAWPMATWAISRIYNEVIAPLMSCFP